MGDSLFSLSLVWSRVVSLFFPALIKGQVSHRLPGIPQAWQVTQMILLLKSETTCHLEGEPFTILNLLVLVMSQTLMT